MRHEKRRILRWRSWGKNHVCNLVPFSNYLCSLIELREQSWENLQHFLLLNIPIWCTWNPSNVLNDFLLLKIFIRMKERVLNKAGWTCKVYIYIYFIYIHIYLWEKPERRNKVWDEEGCSLSIPNMCDSCIWWLQVILLLVQNQHF